MSEKKNKNHGIIWLKAWRAKMFLRIHGFLADSEHKKIVSRIENYADKHGIFIEQSDIEKQRLI